MKDLIVVIVGGGAGFGALLAEMAVRDGARGVGVIDINASAAETALEPARKAGLAVAVATADISRHCFIAKNPSFFRLKASFLRSKARFASLKGKVCFARSIPKR